MKKIDLFCIGIYILFGGLIFFFYRQSVFPQKTINTLLLALTFGGPLSLFWMYYQRFREKLITLIWFGLGLIQWYILNGLKSNSDFKSAVGSYANYDKTLIGLVILLTIFRIISLVFTKQEFMIAAWFSPKDNRKLNTLDTIFTFVGFLSLIGLSEI
ncbi:hypothetical protein JJL45_11795 [Tamlana sp. s12]|uniref:hypothetical protein n=1 Tax=Tamlana sp. s12 TaxID=1630406 RepID=UPI000AE6C28F|nr:hypothetical protein [Tamlana sp. s12]QQY81605.1 hypothetical protein JJL45_11795 [Tamlana sp. s12]